MSYDICVFLPDAAPEDQKAFEAWYDALTLWREGHNYSDPANSAPQLQAWRHAMTVTFPPMNGPDRIASDHPDFDSPYVTDYCCAKEAIYAAFAWSVGREAYELALKTAALTGVGFFDASGAGAIWRPTPTGYRISAGGVAEDYEFEKDKPAEDKEE